MRFLQPLRKSQIQPNAVSGSFHSHMDRRLGAGLRQTTWDACPHVQWRARHAEPKCHDGKKQTGFVPGVGSRGPHGRPGGVNAATSCSGLNGTPREPIPFSYHKEILSIVHARTVVGQEYSQLFSC
jgi:hypothetical protein